jgi:hypothetical protein
MEEVEKNFLNKMSETYHMSLNVLNINKFCRFNIYPRDIYGYMFRSRIFHLSGDVNMSLHYIRKLSCKYELFWLSSLREDF